MTAEEIKRWKTQIDNDVEDIKAEAVAGSEEAKRVAGIMRNTRHILDDLDNQFERQTGLNANDVAFLFLAAGLQIVRQYCVTKFPERKDAQTSAEETVGYSKEHSNRRHKPYNPSLNEIIENPAPFDANIGANGALSGGGKMGHRVTAIGHDPVLGLVFGTANIATSTLTTSRFESYHIVSGEAKTRGGFAKRDIFGNRADTGKILFYTKEKMLNEGLEGKVKVFYSLRKEIQHLRTDINSKNSLPLPVIPVVSPELASDLASYGLDMANVVTVGKQMAMAVFINSLIAMFHGMYYDGKTRTDRKLYEVKTRKVLSYSDLIASSTNLAVVAITRDFSKLDLGGLAVTIYRLITDRKFIHDIKQEFIFGTYKDMILGDADPKNLIQG